MPIRHALGRGLDALIKDGTSTQRPPVEAQSGGILKIPIDQLSRNALQPRRRFAEENLAELADSIRVHGILQPLLVRKSETGFELIAGERRLRAAGLVGLKEVPVRILDASGSDSLELALVENLQRADLNPIEEAEGYQMLADKFSLTQELIAQRVGKARVTVTNCMRLLALPEEVRRMVAEGSLSSGHAKVLLGLTIPAEQTLYARRAAQEQLSVRQLEKLVERAVKSTRKPRASRTDLPSNHLAYLSEKLHAHFGTNVRLVSSKTLSNGKKLPGRLEVDFYSNDDLDRILSILGISLE